MKVVLIGVGQAGGKITEALLEFDRTMEFGAVLDAHAINTAEADLGELDLDTTLIGKDRVNGHGVGGDNELGAEIMRDDSNQVLSALDSKLTANTEAIVIVAGLGGGTGSGGAPALAHELQEIYDLPLYVLGALPGEGEGAMYQVNAGRSLKTLTREADSTLLIDNDAWHDSGESLEEGFDAINRAIAQRVGLLFAAGEAVEQVGESVVDSSEVINTLREGGISALGYASAQASADASENVNAILSATRQSLLTGTSLPDAATANAALLVVAGHPDAIPRKGVERARRWIEEQTESLQVRGGDFPLESKHLAALVLLGGVERSTRVEQFMQRAREARDQEERPDPRKAFETEELEDLF